VRFYRIELTTPDGQPLVPESLKGLGISSLLPNGQFNPAALQVELDISVVPHHVPEGRQMVAIWGLSLKDLSASFNLNDCFIAIYGGMSKGLPLAVPNQARLLTRGKIFQAFGKWVGTEQCVIIIFQPDAGSIDAPKNFVLNWKAGDTLASALDNCLSTAMPDFKTNINISSRLVRNYDDQGYYQSLDQLAFVVNGISKSIISDPNYPGVTIAPPVDDTINVTDFIGPPPPAKLIDFQDLVGQPTWLDPVSISVQLVMRGDIQVSDIVTMPRTLITNSQSVVTRFRDNSIFTGNYYVKRVHHYGDFRQPDAAAWNTTLDLVLQVKGVTP
jgi:hypothetical protein